MQPWVSVGALPNAQAEGSRATRKRVRCPDGTFRFPNLTDIYVRNSLARRRVQLVAEMGNTARRMYVSSVRGQRTVSTQQRARQLLLAPRYQLWRQHAVSAHWEVGYVFTYAATLSSPKARGEKEITDGATPTRPDIKGLTRPRPLFWSTLGEMQPSVRSCKLMLMMHVSDSPRRGACTNDASSS
jgi:hypothetical protein